MICSPSSVHHHNHDSAFGQGCNSTNPTLSVPPSDSGAFGLSQSNSTASPKKAGFFASLMARNSPKPTKKEEPKVVKSPSWSLFSKKPSSPQLSPTSASAPSPCSPPALSLSPSSLYYDGMDEATADLIAQLQLEGRSDQDIATHLSYIQHATPSVVPTPPAVPIQPPQPSPRSATTNLFTQFIRDIQETFSDELVLLDQYGNPQYDTYEDDLRHLTVGISSGPFFAALPPNTDMTYEELAGLEPVYVGAKCVNSLPSCVHDGTPLPGDQSRCAICLGDFEEGNTLKSLPCVHFYHKDCIDSWLLVGHTCPVCKFLVE